MVGMAYLAWFVRATAASLSASPIELASLLTPEDGIRTYVRMLSVVEQPSAYLAIEVFGRTRQSPWEMTPRLVS